MPSGRPTANRGSDASGFTFKPNRHLALIDNDRHFTLAFGKFEQFIDAVWVFDHIDVIEILTGLFECFTSRRGKGSGVLAKDEDVFCHGESP